MTVRQRSAVVVGAGPNGLAAAVELARRGWRVRVLEAAERAGGGLRSAALTVPGFVHDVCSAVHPLAVASPFFSTLPLDRHGLEWVHPGAALAHPFDDGTAAVVEGSAAATDAALGAAGAYLRVLEPLGRGWRRLAPDLLGPLLRRPRAPLLAARFALHGLQPATAVAVRLGGARAAALFAGCAAHSGLPLDAPASAAYGLVLLAAAHAVGWPFPRGGAQRLADALVGVVEELGGEVETGRRVTVLEEAAGVDAVLLDVAPAALVAMAGSRLPRGYRHRLERFRHGPGVFKLDLALDGPVPWAAEGCRRAGTVHLGGTAAEVAAAEVAVWRGEHSRRPFVILAQPSLFDPSRAPAGGHVVWAYCHVPWGSEADMTGAVESQIERFAPGFRRRVVARRTWTTAALEAHDANLVGGDINGGTGSLVQLLRRPVLRANPYATPVPGVFLCSASTPPGGGVHGMCGYHAARAALRATVSGQGGGKGRSSARA